MENEEKNKEQQYHEAYEFAVNLMVNSKADYFEAKEALVNRGLDEKAAEEIVEHIEGQISEAKRARANKDMLYGALWCIGGSVITAITYSAASNGGRYMVFWGAIIFGAVQFFKGLFASMK
jgi:hypothetical protein